MSKSEEAFPRSCRLLKPDEYRRVFNRGKRSSDRLFLVLAIPNVNGSPRLGLAVA
ncbi:MAG: ribonuclease P protein component, partial [Candidatus Thiodiazotropha sp.]